MSTEKYNIELSANALKMRGELDKANKKLRDLEGGFQKADDKQKGFTFSGEKLAKGMALVGTALLAATSALVAYSTVQGRAIRETEVLATMAGLTNEEFRRQSFVMGTVGISAEKYGDIMKDTQEKVGDFLATGGGAFQDFADVMKLTEKDALSLANEFENMSGDQVLKAMVRQMEDAGVSTQKMSFALEGMASDTTRLIPLLKDGGNQADLLGKKFDEINIELSDEERQQFKDLADNVDLAQGAFVNFINNAIAPFLPAVNKAAESLANFFAIANDDLEVSGILDNHALIENIDSLSQIEKIQKAVNAQINDYSVAIGKYSEAGLNSDDFIDHLVKLHEINAIIEARGELLKAERSESQNIETASTNTSSSGGRSGADSITDGEALEKELESLQDAKKTKLKILREEKDERLRILDELYSEDAKNAAHYTDLKKQVDQDYRLQILEFATTDEQAKQDAYANELASLREFYDNKLISEEDYQAKLNEIIAEFAPSTLNPELLEEENQRELEALQEKLDNKLILHREYYERLAVLEKKDLKDKEDKNNTEIDWSKSNSKKQIEDGIGLLNAVGTNSKKMHKLKQAASAANAYMNTAEGITDALKTQNYASAALIAATGAIQIAAILSSSPDGGGSSSTQAPSQPQAQQSFTDQSATVTDISSGAQDSMRISIEFSDEIVDTIGRKYDQAKSDGRI